jgi:class 3 adenylate cyclase
MHVNVERRPDCCLGSPLAATWVVSGAVSTLLNLHGGVGIAIPTLLGVVLGGGAAAAIGVLLTQQIARPILLAATQPSERLVAAPGVLARLILLWLLCSAIPSGVIVALIFVRSNGWLIPQTASVDIAVLVVSLAAVLLGLPIMILTSRSISDPIGEVVDAMSKVEKGQFDTAVDVFERSEIGRLQSGFNRMVLGLAERERVRDLFGRHVGDNVARRAIEEGASMSGDVQEAAVLFIDLAGSTQLAASYPPQQVAEVLNDFFRIVVNAVDEHEGLINKFQGDAALAVFGAPLRTSGAPRRHWRQRAPWREQLRAAAGRLRHRRLGGFGLRGKHRCRKSLRVHGDRDAVNEAARPRSRQDIRSTYPVFVVSHRARRCGRTQTLGLQGQ